MGRLRDSASDLDLSHARKRLPERRARHPSGVHLHGMGDKIRLCPLRSRSVSYCGISSRRGCLDFCVVSAMSHGSRPKPRFFH